MATVSVLGRAASELTPRDRETIERYLAGVVRLENQTIKSGRMYSVPVKWGDPFEPWVLRFMLVDVIGCRDLGRGEKVAWVCALATDGTPIEFSFRKFGLSAAVGECEDEEAASALVNLCLRRLERALPLVERKLIRPLIDHAIETRRITVSNQLSYFLEMHEYLRNRAEAAGRDASGLIPITTLHETGSSVEYPAVKRARQAEFDAHSSLFALFSMLEHLLIIELSLRDVGDPTEDVAGFLRLTWSQKFKRLVDLSNSDNKRVYDIFKKLADENRNPSAHGGIDKKTTNLSVHLQGYGAVPVGVFPGSSNPTFTFHPRLSTDVFPFASPMQLGEGLAGWAAVDEVIDWIKGGPLSSAYSYGESGLPVLLDDDNRAQAWEAREEDEVAALIEYRGWLVDTAANMDW